MVLKVYKQQFKAFVLWTSVGISWVSLRSTRFSPKLLTLCWSLGPTQRQILILLVRRDQWSCTAVQLQYYYGSTFYCLAKEEYRHSGSRSNCHHWFLARPLKVELEQALEKIQFATKPTSTTLGSLSLRSAQATSTLWLSRRSSRSWLRSALLLLICLL